MDRVNVLAANKLAKWRVVFASRFMGTKPDTDESCKAFKDVVEQGLLLRAEVSGILGLLIKKGVVTHREAMQTLTEEYAWLDRQLEERYPGFTTDQDGIHMEMPQAAETMKGWPK